MITATTLPDELISAAAALEQRFKILRVQTRKVPLEEWNSVPEHIHHLIPVWVPALLSQFSLLGGVLECQTNPDKQTTRTWPRYFSFWGPETYSMALGHGDESLPEDFIADGMTLLADEQNGDVWIIRASGGPDSPIFLYDDSGHERIFASSRIALLISSMAVSVTSYGGDGMYQITRTVMWHPDVTFDVYMTPGAAESKFNGWIGRRLKILLKECAEDRVNAELLSFLAERLEIRADQMRIFCGEATWKKTIEVTGVEDSYLRRRLAGLE